MNLGTKPTGLILLLFLLIPSAR